MAIQDRFDLTDRTAVVTGAGRGIGAACAVALAEAGANVVLAARSADQLDKVAEQISGLGRKAATVSADLSTPEAAQELAQAAVDNFGRLDVVVNNVGGAMPRDFLSISAEELQQAFAFNVGTAHELTRAAVPHMLKREAGSVINISSMMGRVAGRGYLTYGTVKAALTHYTRLAATDLAPKIRVNAVAPGAVATSALDIVTGDDNLREQVESAAMLKRIGEPEEIAAAVLYLASDASSFTTGRIIEVDGGTDRPSLELGMPDLG